MDEKQLSLLANGIHPIERQVLALFRDCPEWPEAEVVLRTGLKVAQVSMALGWLQTKALLAVSSEHASVSASLSEIGSRYARDRHPPLRMAEEIRRIGSVPIRLLQERTDFDSDEKSEAIGALKKSGSVQVSLGQMTVVDPGKLAPFEALQSLLEKIASSGKVALATLSEAERQIVDTHHRKRSKLKGIFLIEERVERTWVATPLFAPLNERLAGQSETAEAIGAVTPELLKTGGWQGKSFRKYNIELPAERIEGGQPHPYRRFLDRVKQQFVAMGFAQVRGPLVESEFWNMDALFMPQFHPARAIHDVYFVKGNLHDETIPDAQVARVAAAHENGGESGSRGWRYAFDAERTRRLILRSQGTAVSARTLGARPNVPGKYFSIARCFRYDQVDATHAPDFFQVEGIVLGAEIRFTTLLGLLTLFAKEIAQASEVQFRPAYFPFTEPSVELHVRHPKLGWMELGGAGLLRPEVTRPLDVNVPVIAWGLGLDRMAMVALNISDIRDLFSTDLGLIRKTAMAAGKST
jgi:phenylalanyl-tRNA synthetase alpha chain